MSDTSLRYDVPGNRLICCMCIEWFDFSDLYVDEDGITWDFCTSCAHEHAVAMVLLIMAGRTVMVPDYDAADAAVFGSSQALGGEPT